MSLHESSVNFENLIKDLADMYPYEVAEVVLIELIANALDAKADRIYVEYDKAQRILTVTDNGKGMTEGDFDQYHDFAAGLKFRGTGIGFAGVGAKISFNIASQVITETRSKSFSGGSNWYLQSKKNLVWEDITPSHLIGNGTRVEIHFKKDANITYSSREEIINLLKLHYLPLLDTEFLRLYSHLNIYSENLRFVINGIELTPFNIKNELQLNCFKEFYPTKSGKRVGYGIFGLSSKEYPLDEGISGVMLTTWGKVIKTDYFNQYPGALGTKIFGLVEVPQFVNFLTTSKTDFIKRSRHKDFESLYDPIRQQFKSWLIEIGVDSMETMGTDDALKLEREIKKLIDALPELAEFFGFSSKKKILTPDDSGLQTVSILEGSDITYPIGDGERNGNTGFLDEGENPGLSTIETNNGDRKASPISRVGKRGPKIAFKEVFDKDDLSWVDGDIIVINTGHPCYIKARSNISLKRLHEIYSVACAIQKFIASEDGKSDYNFIDRMMAAWGRK